MTSPTVLTADAIVFVRPWKHEKNPSGCDGWAVAGDELRGSRYDLVLVGREAEVEIDGFPKLEFRCYGTGWKAKLEDSEREDLEHRVRHGTVEEAALARVWLAAYPRLSHAIDAVAWAGCEDRLRREVADA